MNAYEYKNLLLIDQTVPGYQDFVDSVNAETFSVVYSPGTTTQDDVMALLLSAGITCLNRIGLVFVSSGSLPNRFLNSEPFFTDIETTPYSENVRFIVNLIKDFGVKNIDYLGCNTLKYPNWENYYTILNAETGVVVGASNDRTGNIKYGGDWVMESTGEDIELIYFTSSIEYYTYLLDLGSSTFVNINGTVYGTGYDNYGQLGINSTTNRLILTAMTNMPSGKTPIAISCGNYYTIVLMNDGTVYGTGINNYGQLGYNTTTDRRILTAMTNIPSGKTPIAISCGGYHTIVLMSDGTVYGTGINNYGQLGYNTTTNRLILTAMTNMPSGKTPIAISCGNYYTIVLMNDGTVYGTGDNNYGQLGDNTITDRQILTAMTNMPSGKTPIAISCGAYYTIVLMNDGTVYGTGYNTYGQLGINSTTDRQILTQMKGISGTGFITDVSYLLDNTVYRTGYTYGNVIVDNATVITNSINTNLNTILYQVVNTIDTFTNTGILLGGGGSGGEDGSNYGSGNNGADALVINANCAVANLINKGSLAGGGGGGGAGTEVSGNGGGNGGSGGGGGGAGSGGVTAGRGGNGGGGSNPNGSVGTGGGGGGGGGFGGIGGNGTGTNSTTTKKGGDGATSSSIFASVAGTGGGGASAGGGNSYGSGVYKGGRSGGGSGGGLGGAYTNVVGEGGGNGGFGIQNLGFITNLYNAQNLSNGYGPLYMAGTAPTKYYITILGDTSYGQLFSSSNGNLTNGLDLTGSIIFDIDPASVLTIGMKTYTNVLSGVSLNVFTGTGTYQNKSYTWYLNKNEITKDNNGIAISNYDLCLNLIVPGIDISLSTFNRSKLVVDSSTNKPNIYSPFDISYGTTDISLSYSKANASTILDLSVNTTSYVDIATPFNIPELESGDNSLNFTLYSSDRSSNVPYVVVVHVQTANTFSFLTLYNEPVTFNASYSARLEVPYGMDDISGQYTLVDPSANVDLSVNNLRQQRGMSSPFDVSGLAVGDNSLNFMVTAYDKQTKKPYFVQVYMQTANTIKTLFLNKNRINLSDPSLIIDVSNGINNISGSYYLEDTRATVDVSVNQTYSQYSVAASFDVPQLATGDNALNLTVTAYDKKTVKTYPINVHVQTSNRFSNLYLNNQRIVFSNFIGTKIDVSYSADGITGDYYTVDPGTTVDLSVNTTYYTASDIDPSFNVRLQPKDNSLNFMVTSSDNTKQPYLVKIYMQTSTDFATLTLNNTIINWSIDNNGNNIGYLGVSFGIKDISGSYSLVDTLAKVDMSVNTVSFPNISSSSFNINNLQKGENNVYFYVKSSDGFTKKIYYVNIGVQSTLSVSTVKIKENGRINFKSNGGKLSFCI